MRPKCAGGAAAGHSEAFIDSVEHDLRVAELDERESARLGFSRKLARSRPQPALAERTARLQLGYSSLEIAELASFVAGACLFNRVNTLMACPLELARLAMLLE